MLDTDGFSTFDGSATNKVSSLSKKISLHKTVISTDSNYVKFAHYNFIFPHFYVCKCQCTNEKIFHIEFTCTFMPLLDMFLEVKFR